MSKHLRQNAARLVVQLSVVAIVATLSFFVTRTASTSALGPLLLDETAQTFAADCVTPKTFFKLGEQVCGRLVGSFLGPPVQRRFQFADPENYVRQSGPNVSFDPQTTIFTLPLMPTSTLGGVVTVDNRGRWRFGSGDSESEGRAVAYFNVDEHGIEGDVAPRPNGDGTVQSNDVVQVQRFQIGLDPITPGSSEFARADSAPLATGGDGLIQSNDVVQTQRFQIGLDPLQNVSLPESDGGSAWLSSMDEVEALIGVIGGPNAEPGGGADAAGQGSLPRSLKIEQAPGNQPGELQVTIMVDAVGDEAGYGFTLAYDPTLYSEPRVNIGTAGGSRLCNTSVSGLIVCSVSYFVNNFSGSKTKQIGEVRGGTGQVLASMTFRLRSRANRHYAPVELINVNSSNDLAEVLNIVGRK